MNAARRSRFVYVTVIRTTPRQLWEALTDPEFIRQYWYGAKVECAWKKGAPWRMELPDGRLADSGEILEIDPPRRLVIRWQNEWKPEMRAEGSSLCTIELTPLDDAVKLTITHELDRPDSTFIEAISGGWPFVVANLKSLLETGQPATTAQPGHQ